MDNSTLEAAEQKRAIALGLMEEALSLLDDSDTPGEIGADLDLAICRLRKLLADIPPDSDRLDGHLREVLAHRH